MTGLSRRRALAILASLPLARPAHAELTPYRLDPGNTSVRFTFDLSGVAQSGTMPIASADIRIDMARLQNSRVNVTLDVSKARTRLPFARIAMLGPEVLDAARFPTIHFRSTRIRLGAGGRLSDGAMVSGDLTIRDVTRPLTLQASLYRKRGSAPDDLDNLSIRLTGALNRNAFGASGYSDLVGETVGLDIHAEIDRVA